MVILRGAQRVATKENSSRQNWPTPGGTGEKKRKKRKIDRGPRKSKIE